MADTKTTALTLYTTPLPDDLIPVVDVPNSTTKAMTVQTLMRNKINHSTASQAGFAADTYLTGSNITIPTGAPDVGTTYRCIFDMVKTAAGTATPIIQVRIGTAGSVADTSRCSFTLSAGTAATDTGRFEIICVFRTVGSSTSAVLQGDLSVVSQPTTGITSLIHAVQTTSGGFDSTVANSIIGVSVNGGASAAWTAQFVRAELIP